MKSKILSFVQETTHLDRGHGVDFGWGNGYVIVPKGHPWHGVDNDHVDLPESINGGLTFSSPVNELKKDSWTIPSFLDYTV